MQLSKLIIPILLVGVLGISAYYYFKPDAKTQVTELKKEIQRDTFVITVTATGELNSKKSTKIRVPQGMEAANIYNTTISDLVPEGTILKAGDYVGSLDRTEVSNKMSNVQSEIDKTLNQLEQAKIDTAIDLRGIRDQIINNEFTKTEKVLKLDQSRYEPQSVIQQAKLDLERTERDLEQLRQNYKLKQQQAQAKIQEINTQLKQQQNTMKQLVDLANSFSIYAPEGGMLIYARTWNGKKEPGARVSPWESVVAELPDLTDMISKTFVNEVEISKVKKGQEVEVKIDAFPDKKYSGKVLQVANVGQQIRGYDAKVFEVIVQVLQADSIMRPAMTTSNEIVVDIIPDVLSIPLEALQSDSVSYVLVDRAGKNVRQEIITGLSNNTSIIVENGLQEGDKVYLSVQGKAEDWPFVALDPAIKEAIRKKMEEEEQKRKQQALERLNSIKNLSAPSSSGGGGGDVFIVVE